MTASGASVGYGVILKKGNGGTPETFTDYGLEVTNVTGVGFSRTAIDATHMQSPDGYAEFIFGLKQQKPFTVEFNWNQTVVTVAALQTILEGSQGNWQFLFPSTPSSSVTSYAGISDFSLGTLTPDGKMSATMTFTPSGKPTWA